MQGKKRGEKSSDMKYVAEHQAQPVYPHREQAIAGYFDTHRHPVG
jgi:hypothetical protein